MKSIRANLLKTFLVIIGILSFMTIVLFALNIWMVRQYKSISDVMISEYKLTENSTKLIDAFNTRVQSAGTNEVDSQARIEEANKNIQELTIYLDNAIDDIYSRSDYLGFKASIEKFTTHIHDSLYRFEQGSIKDYFSDYNEANKIYGFVRNNGTSLIFTQLKYTSSIQDAINQTYLMGVIAGLCTLLLLIIASVFLAIKFSDKLTLPIKNLDMVAQKIAKGETDIIIADELLNRNDEIGSLSRSYKTMIGQLFKNITELNTVNKNISQSAEALKDKNNELEQLNNLMVDRELKMVQLKKEVEELKKKV